MAMLKQRQELEKKAESLHLVQLAVAKVRERVFAEIEENGIKEGLSHQPQLPPEVFHVPGLSLSGLSFPPCPVFTPFQGQRQTL